MTPKMKLLLLAATIIAAVGCSSMGTTAKALAKDGAIVHVDVARQILTRVGTTTNSVHVSHDGSITINGTQPK